jgi:hypothetical protein
MESLSFGGLDGQAENNLIEDILSLEDMFGEAAQLRMEMEPPRSRNQSKVWCRWRQAA